MKAFAILIFISFLTLSCQKEEKRSFDLLLTNAHIVDVKTDSVFQNKLIGIVNDTIQIVENMKDLGRFQAQDTIDAKNNYVMPGLWDMHVHFRGGDSLVEENKELLKLFLAYGITTVRDAGGDITPEVLKWRKNISGNSQDGPRIFSSGPKLDGEKPAWEGSIPVSSSVEISSALDSLDKMNTDYVKIYDGSLNAETFYEILKQAEERGLNTTSHVPMSADLLIAADLGLDGVEHMYYIAKAGSPLADSLSKTDLGYRMMPYILESFDEELAKQVYKKLASENVSITPTLHIGKVLSNLAEEDHSSDSLRNYVGEGIQKTYRRRIESAKRAKASGNNFRDGLEELFTAMIVPMYENGVNILAGSDSGAFNSFVYSGESLHSELEALVGAGLTPTQALKTSIINGPKFFDLEQYYGSIEEGKVADIIILKANPLVDIKNTRSIERVIKNQETYNPGKLLRSVQN